MSFKASFQQMGVVGLATLAVFPVVAQSQSVSEPRPFGIVGAPAGTGAYAAVAEYFASMPMNMVYHPSNMPNMEMPLILWGNGGCRDNGLNNGAFLREVASHGFVIVAAGPPTEERGIEVPPAREPGATPPPRPATPPRAPAAEPQQRPADPTSPQQLIDAIQWAEQQNSDPFSQFYGKVDLDNIGTMGHSCGGLQAVVVAADPRVDTAILFNSGVLNDGPASGASGIAVVKSQLQDIHGPVAYINGGPTDVAYRNAEDDFARIDHVPVFYGENGVGHGGTFWSAPNGGEYAQVATAWMAWQLKQDEESGEWFQGADCKLCVNPDWKIKTKNIE